MGRSEIRFHCSMLLLHVSYVVPLLHERIYNDAVVGCVYEDLLIRESVVEVGQLLVIEVPKGRLPSPLASSPL